MKTIIIKISDSVFKEIRTHMNIRGMTGEACGVVDEFVVKFIEAIEKELPELTLQLKAEKE